MSCLDDLTVEYFHPAKGHPAAVQISVRHLCRQFEVLDVAWDATLGGELLDLVLIDHFASEFADKNPGLDPRSSPKVMSFAAV